MRAADYRHYLTTCSGGINQQADLARDDQCSDAVNVWAPNGTVERRPGCKGTMPPLLVLSQTIQTWPAVALSGFAAILEDGSTATFPLSTTNPTVGTLVVGGAVARSTGVDVGDRWYIGFDDGVFVSHTNVYGWYFALPTANTNLTITSSEYWNGTKWSEIDVYKISLGVSGGVTYLGVPSSHLSAIGTVAASERASFLFVHPGDWSKTTVDGSNLYFIRFNVLNDNISAGTQLNDAVPTGFSVYSSYDNNTGDYYPEKTSRLTAVGVAQMSSEKQYFNICASESVSIVATALDIFGSSVREYLKIKVFNETQHGTLAVVAEFDEYFVGIGEVVYWLSRQPNVLRSAQPATPFPYAEIEYRDFAIGSGAPYAKSYISQLDAWPNGSYISYFGNRLWVSGMPNDPFGIRWSAPAPYHKVWPQLSRAALVEDDNSPITGMAPLGENMVIFKQDSIWVMLDTGLDVFGLRNFVPQRMVAGIGCVANSSIQQVRGSLVFLSEDGVYAFDGTPNIKKISAPVTDSLKKISIGRRTWVSSVNWKTKHAYVLSFSTGGMKNDLTLVWDYQNNTWWKWTGIYPQFWMLDEGAANEEVLYWIDEVGATFQMGGSTDHGAPIVSSVTTSRIGFRGGLFRKRLREIVVNTINKAVGLTVQALVNDNTAGTSTTFTTIDPSETTLSRWFKRRRYLRAAFREEFTWLQVKVTHNEKYRPFELASIDVGFKPIR